MKPSKKVKFCITPSDIRQYKLNNILGKKTSKDHWKIGYIHKSIYLKWESDRTPGYIVEAEDGTVYEVPSFLCDFDF